AHSRRSNPHARRRGQCCFPALSPGSFNDHRTYPGCGWRLLHLRMNAPTLSDSGLEGSVAIVTGGSGGIGRAIVQMLGAAGMEVVFTYHRNSGASTELTKQAGPSKVTAEAL